MNKHPKTSESASHPEGPQFSLISRVLVTLVAGVIVVWLVGTIVTRRQAGPTGKDGPGPTGRSLGRWQDPDSGSASSRVVDPDSPVVRFVRLRRENDPRALDLLGPAPVFDDTPVEETRAEEMQVDFFLRSPSLELIEVLPGVPVGSGKQRPREGYYTIVTKGNIFSPSLRIRTATNRTGAPSSLSIFNPDLVVEVRDGKLYGRKAELPLR